MYVIHNVTVKKISVEFQDLRLKLKYSNLHSNFFSRFFSKVFVSFSTDKKFDGYLHMTHDFYGKQDPLKKGAKFVLEIWPLEHCFGI